MYSVWKGRDPSPSQGALSSLPQSRTPHPTPPAPRIWGPQPQAPSCWRKHHASSSLGAGGFNGAAWEQQLREQVAAPGAGQAHLALHLGTHLRRQGRQQPPGSQRSSRHSASVRGGKALGCEGDFE